MTLKELAAELNQPAKQIRKWVAAGMPCQRRGRAYNFDAAAVAEWLVANGHARSRQTVRTQAEIANHFGVADRTVAYWRGRGMPGEPGDYDLDEIEAWREREGLARVDANSVKAEGQRIDNELKQLKLDQARGTLVAIDVIVRLFIRHIHEAKAILDQVPDRAVSALPAKTPRKIRTSVRAECRKIVDGACQSIADLLTAEEIKGSEPAD